VQGKTGEMTELDKQLAMILCQQSAFIISAVLMSTLKYIFHSKF